MDKALFLDRDGIINEDTGYISDISEIVFNFDIFNVCRTAIAFGYKIIVVTNQSGITKRLYTGDDVIEIHNWISNIFEMLRIPITAFYYCPFDTDVRCRKPNPGMILQAVDEHNIDISRSLMVGDKPSDRIKLDNLKSLILYSEYTGDDYDISEISEIEDYLTIYSEDCD